MLLSPRLELLEGRIAPNSTFDMYQASSPPPPSTYDPTMTPADPGNTTVAALITAVGGWNGVGGYSITVSGLSSTSLSLGASVTVGNVTTTITSATTNPDGTISLVLNDVPGLSDAIADAALISVNTGTTPPTNPPTDPPPPPNPFDPTMWPTGP